uniref:Uncharacterized protein n=1 Tax=Arundo donax TaxID=35708 RepID=A0A0A9BM39_ARUDO
MRRWGPLRMESLSTWARQKDMAWRIQRPAARPRSRRLVARERSDTSSSSSKSSPSNSPQQISNSFAGAPPRRSSRWSTKLRSVHAVQRLHSLRRQSARGATRMAGVDCQRWRQLRASTLLRTASSEGSRENRSSRRWSGSALMRSSPPCRSSWAFRRTGEGLVDVLRAGNQSTALSGSRLRSVEHGR